MAYLSADSSSSSIYCGYDLSSRTKQQVYQDMVSIGLNPNDATVLSQAAGLDPNSGLQYLKSNGKKVILSEEQQLKLFQRLMTELEHQLKAMLSSLKADSVRLESLKRYQVDVLLDLLQAGELRNPDVLSKTVEVLSQSINSNNPNIFNRYVQNFKFWVENAGSHPDRLKKRSAFVADASKKKSTGDLGGICLDYSAEKLLKNPDSFSFDGVQLDLRADGGVYLLRRGGQKISKSIDLNREGVTMSDLAVCLKIYYDPSIKHKGISFSLDPYDPKNPDGPYMRKVYWPDEAEGRPILAGTKVGDDLFEADFILKQLSLGIKVDSMEPLKTSDFVYPPELANGGLKASYLMSSKKQYGQTNWSRKWIVIRGFRKDDISNDERLGDLLILRNLEMGVEARQMMIGSDGRLVDKVVQDPEDGSFDFAQKLSKLYDVATKYYPSFERVRQIGKAMGIAHWLYKKRVPVDLDLINALVERQRTKFTDKVPSLKRQESRTWEEIQKVPVDLKALATKELEKRGVTITDDIVNKAVEQIKKANPHSDFCETHVTKHTETRYVFGGVSLNLKGFDDESTQDSFKLEKAEVAKVEDTVRNSERVPFPLLMQETCEVCSDYVRPLEARYPIEGKKYYCRYHHPFSCQNCFNVINGSYIPWKEGKYHQSCLSCVYCEEPIDKAPLASEEGLLHEKCKEKYVEMKKEEAHREFKKKQQAEIEAFVKKNNLDFGKSLNWTCSGCKKLNTNSRNPICGHCLTVDQSMVKHTEVGSVLSQNSASTMSSMSKKSVR